MLDRRLESYEIFAYLFSVFSSCDIRRNTEFSEVPHHLLTYLLHGAESFLSS